MAIPNSGSKQGAIADLPGPLALAAERILKRFFATEPSRRSGGPLCRVRVRDDRHDPHRAQGEEVVRSEGAGRRPDVSGT
jgi:hypothetical protein